MPPNSYVCRVFEKPRIATRSGSMCARTPSRPPTAARRSCVAAPTSRARIPSLNENWSLETIVVISAEASGMRTSPDWKNGWPEDQHAIAVAPRQRADRRQLEIAAQHLDCHGGSGSSDAASGPVPAETARPPGNRREPERRQRRRGIARAPAGGARRTRAAARARASPPSPVAMRARGGFGDGLEHDAPLPPSSQRQPAKRSADRPPSARVDPRPTRPTPSPRARRPSAWRWPVVGAAVAR